MLRNWLERLRESGNTRRGWAGERASGGLFRRPNGVEVNPRGQGPRAEAGAARRLPAFEARGAGGVPPFKYR